MCFYDLLTESSSVECCDNNELKSIEPKNGYGVEICLQDRKLAALAITIIVKLRDPNFANNGDIEGRTKKTPACP